MKKKITEHLITGLGIGFVVTTVSLWFFRLDQAPGEVVMRQFTTWLAASALYGLISLIYDTNAPFPLRLIIHFTACAAVTCIASVVSGIMEFMQWYEWFIYVLPFFVIVYIIIGILVTVVSHLQAKIINSKIDKSNR